MSRDIDIDTFEEALVRNCSPTLAGLKPAALFNYPGEYVAPEGAGAAEAETIEARRKALLELAARAQARLSSMADIRIRVLVWRACGALVYIYRPAMLGAYMQDERAAKPLTAEGYAPQNTEACIKLLAERIAGASKSAADVALPSARGTRPCGFDASCTERCRCEFPHELGFFLGYPYEDVAGFIEHDGQNFLAVGAWKVYAHVDQALATFKRYRRLTERYQMVYRRKRSLNGLVCANR